MTKQIFLPNDRQEEVLSGSGNLVVLAGAGSGKTGTLIELLSRLLAGEIPGRPQPLAVERLLALTFAEKAAAEMRERLRLKIEARLAQASGLDQRRWWLSAYHQLDRSDIGTIHGFALKLLRRKALAAGVPARLRPQSDQWLLERLKTDLLLDYLAEGKPELNDLLLWLPFKGQGREEGLLSWFKLMIERQGSFGLGFQVWAEATEMERELESLSADLSDLGVLLDGPSIKAEANYRPALERILAYLGAELAEISEPDAALDSAARWLTAVEKSGNWRTKAAQALKKSIQGHLQKMHAKKAARLLNPLQEQITRLGPLFYHDLDERLERQGQLTFDAMLLKARKLLAQNPGLRAELAAAYPIVLVDEFQDTNQVQADLLAYLALPPEDDQIYPEDYPAWSKLAKGHGRLLVFGDPKQSIYRFRGAEPSVMTDLLKTAAAGSSAEQPPVRLVALDSNYRSQEGLIDFYNYFFKSYLGAEQFSANDVQIHTRPRLYQGPQAVWLSWDGQGRSEKAGRLRELELLTGYLKRLLSPAGVIKVGPEARLPRPDDVTILLQRFTHVAQYAAGLRAAGLPVRVVKGFGLWETGAVRALVAAYAYLAGLDRELNLIAVLRSPLAGLGDEALMKLANGSKTGLQAYFKQPGEVDLSFLTTGEADALADLKQLLNGLKPLMARLEPAEIMARLVEQTGLKALLSVEDDGQSKLSALERFLNLALHLPREASGGPLTAADYFVSHLKKLPKREDEPPQDNEAAITIMTIHQAKGLGFPIVVIPEIGARRNYQKSGLIFGPGGRLALRVTDPFTREKLQPSNYDELKNLEDEKSLNDHKRLLYVAATRAKDHLVFLGAAAKSGSTKQGSCKQDSWPTALAQVAEARPDLLGYPAEEGRAENYAACRPPAEANAPDWLPPVYKRLAARKHIKPQTFNFSATSLALALSCPQAYYYQEVLGLSPLFEPSGGTEAGPEDKPLAADIGGGELNPAQKGLIFHNILETWPLDLQAADRPPSALVATLMEQTCGRLGFQPSLGEKQYLEGRVLEFWRQPCGRELLASAAAGLFIDRECPLWLEIKAGPYTYSLTGVIDLYYQIKPGAWRLLDYKLAWPKQIGRYGRQLEIYALALRQAFPPGETLRAGLYFAGSSPPHFEEITLRATEHLEEMAALGDWLAILSSGDLTPPKTDRAACQDQDCPFRQRCLEREYC